MITLIDFDGTERELPELPAHASHIWVTLAEDTPDGTYTFRNYRVASGNVYRQTDEEPSRYPFDEHP
jgi:hypothetical protein